MGGGHALAVHWRRNGAQSVTERTLEQDETRNREISLIFEPPELGLGMGGAPGVGVGGRGERWGSVTIRRFSCELSTVNVTPKCPVSGNLLVSPLCAHTIWDFTWCIWEKTRVALGGLTLGDYNKIFGILLRATSPGVRLGITNRRKGC